MPDAKPISVPITITLGPAIDDTDFKSIESVAWNAAGIVVDLYQEVAGNGATTRTAITPSNTDSATENYWRLVPSSAFGIHELRITAAQNTIAGTLWVVAKATGVLPFESPRYAVNPPLSAQQKLDVNAEADTANTDYGANTTSPTGASVNVATWLGTTPLALSDQQVQAVVPTTQKVDVETIKTKAVTVNAGGTTFPASVGTSTYAGGAVASVTGAVGSITGITFPANFAAMGISVGGVITASGNWNTVTPDAAGTMDAAFTEIKGATWAAGTDTLEAIRNATTGSGAGLPTATITIKNTNTAGAVVAGVTVHVYDSTNTTNVAKGVTNGSGVATIIVPGDATYKVRLFCNGWLQSTNPNSITVSGDTAAEFYMTAFSPGTPSIGLVRIYSHEYRADGGTAIASVSVTALPRKAPASHADGGIAHVDGYKATATTDANGYWYLDLYPATEYAVNLTATRDAMLYVRTPAAGAAATQLESLTVVG